MHNANRDRTNIAQVASENGLPCSKIAFSLIPTSRTAGGLNMESGSGLYHSVFLRSASEQFAQMLDGTVLRAGLL